MFISASALLVLAAIGGPVRRTPAQAPLLTKDFNDLAEQLADGVANNIEWHNNANKERRKWDGAESNALPGTPPYSLALRKMLLQRTANEDKAAQVNRDRAIRDDLGGVVAPTHFNSRWVRQRSEAQIRKAEGTRTGLIPVRPMLSSRTP